MVTLAAKTVMYCCEAEWEQTPRSYAMPACPPSHVCLSIQETQEGEKQAHTHNTGRKDCIDRQHAHGMHGHTDAHHHGTHAHRPTYTATWTRNTATPNR
mmetsp:Transcript_52832/g.132811  ORF Transcript_52832/g.132811 Transcript_52832/m.132811 type:complete len:99 (-) Transcript_52832:1431-1727(-)